MDQPAAPEREDHHGVSRVFLVVIDDSNEMGNALRYACRRAERTGGRVALLKVIEPVTFQGWLGVERRMEEEARAGAERSLQQRAGEVVKQTGRLPSLHLREGDPGEELVKMLEETPEISLLVLATATDTKDPGPLITHMLGDSRRMRVPITLVPGNLSPEEIEALT